MKFIYENTNLPMCTSPRRRVCECVCVCVRCVRACSVVRWCVCQVAKPRNRKMAFNFAHLLSAACGGAPHRLRRLRRPWARCPRAPVVWLWGGGRLVSRFVHRISTLVAKLRNRKWRSILRTCCPPPAAALRAAWGACGAPGRAARACFGGATSTEKVPFFCVL